VVSDGGQGGSAPDKLRSFVRFRTQNKLQAPTYDSSLATVPGASG